MDRDTQLRDRSLSEHSRHFDTKHKGRHHDREAKRHKHKRKYSRSRSSSISDSYSSNYKFERTKAQKQNHKKKKKYKRDRKSSRESRSSRSSRSKDTKEQIKVIRGESRSRSRQRKDEKVRTGPPTRPQFKIKSGFLSSLIIDQKFANKKLDEKDLAKTGEKLQKNFNLDKKPVTMSEYLSNQSLRVDVSQLQNKTYTCQLEKCLKKFNQIEQFQKHIQEHKRSLI